MHRLKEAPFKLAAHVHGAYLTNPNFNFRFVR